MTATPTATPTTPGSIVRARSHPLLVDVIGLFVLLPAPQL